MSETGKGLSEALKALEKQRADFEQAIGYCVEALKGMNQRLERIEKWMLAQEEKKQ